MPQSSPYDSQSYRPTTRLSKDNQASIEAMLIRLQAIETRLEQLSAVQLTDTVLRDGEAALEVVRNGEVLLSLS